jgi:type III restriction enzyme
LDSTWEASEALQLDQNENVTAWVKNDHLGFEVLYTFQGIVRKYRPDFLIQLKTGDFLVLETKGQDTPRDKTKRSFLDEWVKAVNQQGGFGRWSWAVSHSPSDLPDRLQAQTSD